MKQNKVMIMAAALIMIMVCAIPVMAGHGGKHYKGGMDNEFVGTRFLKKFNLSDEQKKQAAGIIKTHKDTIKSHMENMMTLKQAMAEAIHAEVFDEQAVRKACQELSSQKEEMIVLRAKIMNELRTILTPDQVSQLKARKEKKSDKMKLHFEKKWSRFESWLDELEQ